MTEEARFRPTLAGRTRARKLVGPDGTGDTAIAFVPVSIPDLLTRMRSLWDGEADHGTSQPDRRRAQINRPTPRTQLIAGVLSKHSRHFVFGYSNPCRRGRSKDPDH